MSADFVAHMEDVLDLYAEPFDSQRPVVCFDETSTQLLADARPPIPAEPGRPHRQDYEYRREGTRNPFLACEPLAGWRQVAVTQRRTMQDFAHQMRWLVDEAYPRLPVIRVVLDNLNTHRKGSLYQTFPAREARRIARRLEFHYTPKHGSWLNPVLSLSKGWRKSSSASSPAAASGSVSQTRNPAAGRSMPWNGSETDLKPVSTGVLASRTPEPNSIASIPSVPDLTEYYCNERRKSEQKPSWPGDMRQADASD